MPRTRASSRKASGGNDVENKNESKDRKTRLRSKAESMKKIEEDDEDSFKLIPNICKPPDAFDLLCSSPMKQEVSFKPLSFWSQKVKDLESKENIKKKKYELYELSDTEDSSEAKDSSYKDKKRKKKGRPTVGRQKKKIGFDFNSKNLLKKPPIKPKSKNKDGSIVRERIILRRLKSNLKENEEKFSFKNVTAFGLTSTPGKSTDLNLVGGSTFDFLSPITKEISQFSNEVHLEPEVAKSNIDPLENQEITTPRRLRSRKNNEEIISKDRKGVSGSGNVNHLEIGYFLRSELDKSFFDDIDESATGMKSFDLNSVGNHSFEDSNNKLNTAFFDIIDEINSNEEMEVYKVKFYNHPKISEEMLSMIQSPKIICSHTNENKKFINLTNFELRESFRLPFLNKSFPVGKSFFHSDKQTIEDTSISSSDTLINSLSRSSISKVTIRRRHDHFLENTKLLEPDSIPDQINEEIIDDDDINFKISIKLMGLTLYLLKIFYTCCNREIQLTNFSCCELRLKPSHSFLSLSLPIEEERRLHGLNEEYSIVDDIIDNSVLEDSRNGYSNVSTLRSYNSFSNFRLSTRDKSFHVNNIENSLMYDEILDFSTIKSLHLINNKTNEMTEMRKFITGNNMDDIINIRNNHKSDKITKLLESNSILDRTNEEIMNDDNNFEYRRNSFSKVTIRRRYNDLSNVNTDIIDENYDYPNNNLNLNISPLIINDTKILSMNEEDQQSHGKPNIDLMNNIKKRSNRYCSKIIINNSISEQLQLFSVVGNDSSVFISSSETSTTIKSLNSSVSNDDTKILIDSNIKQPRMITEEMNNVPVTFNENNRLKCYEKDKKKITDESIISPVKIKETINEITINDDFDLPPPIFESTKYLSPVKCDYYESEVDNSNLIKSKNQFQMELTDITTCRLIPGKKWLKSALILKKTLNGTLMNETEKKGRKYQTLIREVLNMQTDDVNNENSAELGESIASVVNMMSNLSIKRCTIGNRTVKVLDDSENQKMDFTMRSVSRNFIDLTVVDGIKDDVTPETTLIEEAAKEQVLKLCVNEQCLPFDKYFNEKTLKKCKKIGEGTFGEVFMCGSDRVIKIMPIEGSDDVNGEKQKKYNEILTEMVIAKELSNLRSGDNHRTNGFCELKRSWCVKGQYPKYLIDLWNNFDRLSGSENDSPTMFNSDQLFIILEFENGGKDLEAFVFNTSEEALSIFFQVAFSLAVAEKRLEFEHRDLHWGNILISRTKKKMFEVVLNGKNFCIPTKGVKVTIIDFTLSRITCGGCCIYNDLSVDPTLFTSEGDYQFEVYRLMQRELGNDWSLFRPKTNIFWLHYIADKMVKMARYKSNGKIHEINLAKLDEIKSNVLKYPDAEHLATGFQ